MKRIATIFCITFSGIVLRVEAAAKLFKSDPGAKCRQHLCHAGPGANLGIGL